MPRTKHTAPEKLAILTEYQQSALSMKATAKQYNIDASTLKRWRDKYKRDGLEGLKETHKNNHYSKQLKQMAVQSYLAGDGTLQSLTMKFDLRSAKQLQDWVSLYNGEKPLTASPFRKQVPTMSRKTTFDERIEIVEYVTKDNHSYTEAAAHFGVSYQQARSWVLKVKAGGYEALVDNRGHHKELSELTDLDKANWRIRELEDQLKDQELKDAFVKKLLELQHKG